MEEKLDVWKWVVEAIEVSQAPAIQAVDDNGKYPMSSFFHFYLYVRDSVSLSHLRANVDDIKKWATNNTLTDISTRDHHMYWLIVGLIEAGDIACAEKLVAKFHPDDTRLLAAIHLGCHLAHEVRPLPENEKEAAKKICAALIHKVVPHMTQIQKEMGSLFESPRLQ